MRRSVAALAFLMVACATAPLVEHSVLADRLFCGRSIPGGGSVSDEEWSAFVDGVVTPRFPDGLTIWRADGQWRGKDGQLVHEQVMVIEILHPASLELDRAITEIADEYRRRFHQDAVMRVTLPARMEFVD